MSRRVNQNYVTARTISHRTALKAVNAALEEGDRRGLHVTAAVVDPFFTLVAFAKANGSAHDSEAVTRRKANTAVAGGSPSGWMPESLAVALPLASGNVLTNLAGGHPIRFDGHLVGAIGIGGGMPEDDADIAAAVIRAIGADDPGRSSGSTPL